MEKSTEVIAELVEHCLTMNSCDNCTEDFKHDCKKFKRAIQAITEPADLTILFKAFEKGKE